MTRLIAVCGATGNQGGSVAKLLLQNHEKYRVRALTRNPDSPAAQKLAEQGAEVVKADLSIPSDLQEALRGCWGVFGVTNFYDSKIKDDPSSEERQGKNLVDAVLANGVECLVWSTLPSSYKISGGRLVSRIYEGKHHVDDYIRQKNCPAVFLYTGNFYENMVFRSHMQYNRELDRVEFRQPVIKPDTKLAMLYVQRDLSAVTLAVFDNWDARKDELNHQYLYVANARVTPLEILASVKKGSSSLSHFKLTGLVVDHCAVTGKDGVYEVLPSTGVPDRDIMFQLYNELGMYGTKELPDENILKLGVEMHGIDEFVREALAPHLGLPVL
ncbi:NAD-P-binding protein [Trametes coccinea BRFM310]|uniref:NAD-P-binding protein n=1 Tax=Trametes coccinea (strain BRFM310) TaxID=1353009 RepID=A0A1Y2J498_TRAC3|nr:NAD-P-binding protein [Trametes coccinea BRFM310]